MKIETIATPNGNSGTPPPFEFDVVALFDDVVIALVVVLERPPGAVVTEVLVVELWGLPVVCVVAEFELPDTDERYSTTLFWPLSLADLFPEESIASPSGAERFVAVAFSWPVAGEVS